MNTFDYEEKFFQIHPALKELHGLKEEYILFNERYAGDPEAAALALDALIQRYLDCEHEMFHSFARLLKKTSRAHS